MTVLLESLYDTLRVHQLLAPGARVVVAVSGGPDSLALLHALFVCRDSLAIADLQAAHLDHGLRGDESAAEAQFVADWCLEHGIPCTIGQADTAARQAELRVSVQEAARIVRYSFLEETARRVGADTIATGHTQDDQLETVLLNIMRGTGLDGLAGIPLQRGPFIRPLLHTMRAATEAYCAAQGLSPRHDPTNVDPSHYTRNKVRLELLPLLEQGYHPGVRAALLRLSETARRDSDFLHSLAAATLTDLTLEQTSSHLTLDARRLRLLHPSLLRHVLRTACLLVRGTTQGLSHAHWEPLCEALAGQRRLPFGLTTPAPFYAVRVTERRLAWKRLENPV